MKLATVKPLYKKGSTLDVGNYRLHDRDQGVSKADTAGYQLTAAAPGKVKKAPRGFKKTKKVKSGSVSEQPGQPPPHPPPLFPFFSQIQTTRMSGPGQPPQNMGILSSMLRAPKPNSQQARQPGIRYLPNVRAPAINIAASHGITPGSTRVVTDPQVPLAISTALGLSTLPGGRASPGRTPTTLPPKKSLSPSRIPMYSEAQTTQGQLRLVTPSTSHHTSTPASGQQILSQLPHLQASLRALTDPGKSTSLLQQTLQPSFPLPFAHLRSQLTEAEGLGSQDLNPESPVNRLSPAGRIVGSSQDGNLPRIMLGLAQGKDSPLLVQAQDAAHYPQPAHQTEHRLSPSHHVPTIRRTPSPAHTRVQEGRSVSEAQVPVSYSKDGNSKPVNLSVPHDRPKTQHVKDVIGQGRPGNIALQQTQGQPSFSSQLGDILQRLNQSTQYQTALLQGGLSPITPSEPGEISQQLFGMSAPAETLQKTTVHHHPEPRPKSKSPSPVRVIGIPGRVERGPQVSVPYQIFGSQGVSVPVAVSGSTVYTGAVPSIPGMPVKVGRRTPSPKPFRAGDHIASSIPSSIHMPPGVSVEAIRQPVVSLVKLTTTSTVVTDAASLMGQHQSRSGQHQLFSQNYPVASEQSQFQTRAPSQTYSQPNPFTFPPTPPVIPGGGENVLSRLSEVETRDEFLLKQRHRSEEMPQLVPVSPYSSTKVQQGTSTDGGNNDLVQIPQPFNLRMQTLNNIPVKSDYRPHYRSQTVAIQRAKAGLITSAARSLDLLRQTLQKSINAEIDEIIQKYLDKFFKIGIENIKLNNGETSVTDEHINAVCRQMLEEAKKLYMVESGRRSVTPTRDIPDNISESSSTSRKAVFIKKRRLSDTDSEASHPGAFSKKKKGRQGIPGRSTPSKLLKEPVRREGPKFDPERLTTSLKFVMGSRANKALGFGAMRGRLYIKHPELFKYSGDQDDKQWLYENHHMPATGGKAYILILDDMLELAQEEEYRNSPGVSVQGLSGFCAPEWMLSKMKMQMLALRTDNVKSVKHRSRSTTPSEIKSEPPDDDDDYGNAVDNKVLPFANFSSPKAEKNVMEASPAEQEMEFLSTGAEDPGIGGMSPFNMTGGFDDSASPSGLDVLDDDAGKIWST